MLHCSTMGMYHMLALVGGRMRGCHARSNMVYGGHVANYHLDGIVVACILRSALVNSTQWYCCHAGPMPPSV